MLKADVICPIQRLRGTKGEYRCPICEQLVEVCDGSKKVAYRLTVPPVKALDRVSAHFLDA